jgi:exonuclease III
MDTDEDYLCLVENVNDTYTDLENKGWIDCYRENPDFAGNAYREEKEYGVTWYAFRKDTVNVMITSDMDWYIASVAATELCKALNIQNKQRRIRIFRNLKYREPILVEDMP